VIDFACKRISREELIRCSLNLNKTQYKVFEFMLRKNKKMTVSQIANSLSLERTTVQKAMKGLLKKKIVKRFQRNLSAGGYEFLYELENVDQIKQNLKQILREWSRSAEKVIDGL